jgi:hypothetical protein
VTILFYGIGNIPDDERFQQQRFRGSPLVGARVHKIQESGKTHTECRRIILIFYRFNSREKGKKEGNIHYTRHKLSMTV